MANRWSFGAARDLRDVVITRHGPLVTTFREAARVWVDPQTGAVRPGPSLWAPFTNRGQRRSAAVAWRTLAVNATTGGSTGDVDAGGAGEEDEPDDPTDGCVVVTQDTPDEPSPRTAEYYQSSPPEARSYYESRTGCSPVGPSVVVHEGRTETRVPDAVLPVDVAASRFDFAIASAGNGHTRQLPQVVVVPRRQVRVSSCTPGRPIFLDAQITAVAYAGDDLLLAQSREPAKLFFLDGRSDRLIDAVTLSAETREDTGHAVFHANSGVGVACASCHAEGGDDGHVWRSMQDGARRTPSLRGTLVGTAPYHWFGDAADMADVTRLTFVERMRGPVLPRELVDLLASWSVRLPAPRASSAADPDAASRGARTFAAYGCAGCHAGKSLTSSASVDIGSGGAVQVPSLLGIEKRPPYFHDGRFATLEALLAHDHGMTVGVLSPDDRLDLRAFLGTL